MRRPLLAAAVVLAAALAAASPAAAAPHPVHIGDRGPKVRTVQQLLVRDGFRVAVDGIFGPGTQAAVRRFQRAARLPQVGYVGPHTMAALRSWRRRPVRHSSPNVAQPASAPGGRATLTAGGYAIPPAGAPVQVIAAIAAANRIARTPYKWGGGHRTWNDTGYDCSGSVSYALHGANLLSTTMVSGALEGYGLPGPGTWITVYANATHTFMVIAGLRFDTSGQSRTGSRWQPMDRSTAGFVVRHPAGL